MQAPSADHALWSLNLVQVTESISGSVVPLAMVWIYSVFYTNIFGYSFVLFFIRIYSDIPSYCFFSIRIYSYTRSYQNFIFVTLWLRCIWKYLLLYKANILWNCNFSVQQWFSISKVSTFCKFSNRKSRKGFLYSISTQIELVAN